MAYYYTSERNIQIVISLLKAHGIKRVITSPGATDVCINISLQHDPYFELYSSIDERSAAYMACGMAAETGEPIAITCTGATSSRNYMPGLTEAYYRHLPVLAITCCRSNANVGHNVDQVTDRSNLPNDIAHESVYAQTIHCAEDEWDVMIKVNKAILGLTRNGGGPCHINLATISSTDFETQNIAPARVIKRFIASDKLPDIPDGKKAIFVGAHNVWSKDLLEAVDNFCERYNAVVLCDRTSNYNGKYGISISLISEQMEQLTAPEEFDLMIHIGNISSTSYKKSKTNWRINEDGEIRDTFRKLTNVFQMSEENFFSYYANLRKGKNNSVYEEYHVRYKSLLNSIPELPFSNVWVAKTIASSLPLNSTIHFGIRNSLRSWNYFEVPQSVSCFCNTGGFGIDGGMSSLIGASMIKHDKLYFGVFGDLLFYYDMNCLGNRDISNNLRILIVNNGLGQEFKNYSCFSAMFGDETDLYVAARGHFGNRPKNLIRSYVEILGFEYISASNKDEFETISKRFLSPQLTEKPILFEVFTETEDESKAHELITTLSMKSKMMKKGKELLVSPNMAKVKNIVKKVVMK